MSRLLCLTFLGMPLLLSIGCPDQERRRQLAQRQQVQELQRAVQRCRKQLARQKAAQRARPASQRRLPAPLPRDAFKDPNAFPFQGKKWSARHIPIVQIPKRPKRGDKPSDEKRLRFIRNNFWRYLRIRRKRIKSGLMPRLCRERRRYLRKHPADPQALLTLALCQANHHFKGTLYFQVDFSGAMVIHRKRWRRDDIRAFLSRYRALVNKARSLGFYRLIFVGDSDLKRRHRRLDFTHKWYGQQVTFPIK